MPRDLVLLALSLFTWGIGEGMFIYFQAIYLQRWGANPLQIGAILSMVGVAMAVAQVPAGYLTDRIGSRPVMRSAWVLGVIAAGLMAAANSLPVFVAGLLIYNLTSFVNVPMNSYISSIAVQNTADGGKWGVGRSITVVSAMMHLGTFAGPLMGGLLGERLGLQAVYRISAGIFVVSTAVVFLARRPPVEAAMEAQSETHLQKPNLFNNPRFLGLLALIFLTMFALYLPQPMTPVYLKNQHGYSLETIGQLGAAGSLGNAIIMLGLGSLSAPAGLLVGQALVGLFALLMWRGAGLPLFFTGYFVLGGYRLFRSMALAYTRSLVKTSKTGFAFGLVETGNAVSVIVAPIAAGLLYTHDPQLVYIASLGAIGLVLLVSFTVLRALTPTLVKGLQGKASLEGQAVEITEN